MARVHAANTTAHGQSTRGLARSLTHPSYQRLVDAEPILRRIGRQGIDAATRIVGFFVAAMGMGLIFHGAVEFLQAYQAAARVALAP